MTEIRKTLVFHEDGNAFLHVDTVEHEGQWWLVPRWLIQAGTGSRQPERMIAISQFKYQKSIFPGCYWAITQQLPRFLFDHHDPQKIDAKYVVLLAPEALFPIESGGKSTQH